MPFETDVEQRMGALRPQAGRQGRDGIVQRARQVGAAQVVHQFREQGATGIGTQA